MRIGSQLLLTICGSNIRARMLNDCDARGSGDLLQLQIDEPVCVLEGAQIAISSQQLGMGSQNWRLIGYGTNIESLGPDAAVEMGEPVVVRME